MITNQKLKKALDEIKSITSYDVILYSSKGKHLTGTVEEPAHCDVFVKEFIVSGENIERGKDFIAFEVEIDSELEYVLLVMCPYTDGNLVIGRMAASCVHWCSASLRDTTETILFRILFLEICSVQI